MPAGKIVDHFMFKRHGAAFQVPVRLHKIAERHDGSGSSRFAGPQQTQEVQFGVEFDKPAICLWSTDIEALRAAVMDALADHYKIKWESYWIVEVEEAFRVYDDNGAGIGMSWHEVEIGKTPDGEVVHRVSVGYGRSGTDITKGWPNLNYGTKRRDHVRSLIKATDANTKALEQFAERLTQLRDRMMEFLHPEKIQANLAQLAGLIALQLPAPDVEPIRVEVQVVHTPEVSTKSPKPKKKKKRGKSLPTPKKPRKMRKCKVRQKKG